MFFPRSCSGQDSSCSCKSVLGKRVLTHIQMFWESEFLYSCSDVLGKRVLTHVKMYLERKFLLMFRCTVQESSCYCLDVLGKRVLATV